MIPAPAFLSNPERFMAFSRWAAPLLGASERPIKIVVLGDSLSAGLGLAAEQAFPARLAQVRKDPRWPFSFPARPARSPGFASSQRSPPPVLTGG